MTVFSQVREQAERTPSAVAVIDERGATTYAELIAAAERVAAALAGRVQREEVVGVLMRRDVALVATLLGVWASGAAYLPLDPDDPPARHRTMIAAACCTVVVGDDELLAPLRTPADSADCELIAIRPVVGVRSTADHSCPSAVDAPAGDPRSLAYVLFTSGSTGIPKGVEVEHRQVLHLLNGARDLLRFTAADRYLAVSTIGFDISVAELFLPLVTGGSTVVRDRSLLLDPHALAATIAASGVTVFQTSPGVWALLLREVGDMPRLRVAISTGEPIAPDLAFRLTTVADEAWNLYGPTETTVWAAGLRIEDEASLRRLPSAGAAPIGRPWPNTLLLVCDETGVAVPDGEPGELWIGGALVSRGYRHRPDLTAQRYVERDGVRYYRTGDLVVQGDDGVVDFIGRADDQIKVHGVRIEPMEVEGALLATPGVAGAAATWFEGPSGNRTVVAAIVETARGAARSGRELVDLLAQRLPAAMIPSRIVVCDVLPLTQSGKVDRRAVRELAAGASDLTQRAPDPRAGRQPTRVEQTIIDIWEQVLDVSGIRVDDHFFSVGGDSLAAVTVLLDMEAAFDVDLPITVVLEAPTPADLAARVTAAKSDPEALTNRRFVFPLITIGRGRPVFFAGVDLRIARKGVWLPDCPLYAVAHWALGSGFSDAATIEDLARIHVDGIAAVQSHGPYRIAGYSFGGLLALEIAQQLRDRGEPVELLFLLDPMEPSRTTESDEMVPFVVQPIHVTTRRWLAVDVRRHLHDVPHRPLAAVRYVATRAVFRLQRLLRPIRAWQWLCYHLVHWHGRRPSPVSAMLLPRDRWPAFWYASKRLAVDYVGRPFDGPAVVVATEPERAARWRDILRDDAKVELMVDAHHRMMEEPALTAWLQLLEHALAEGVGQDSGGG